MKQYTSEEWKVESLARKSPDHPIWKDAAWADLDATAEMLIHQNGNVLIYWRGNDPEKNIFLPSLWTGKIAYHCYLKFYEQHHQTPPNQAEIQP